MSPSFTRKLPREPSRKQVGDFQGQLTPGGRVISGGVLRDDLNFEKQSNKLRGLGLRWKHLLQYKILCGHLNLQYFGILVNFSHEVNLGTMDIVLGFLPYFELP